MFIRKHRERGANLVEFALVAVALFLLIFGIIDFARAYNVYTTMTDAAREGARYAVAPDPFTSTLPTISDVQARVQTFLDSGKVKQTTITVTPVTKTINAIDTDYTRVEVSAPYDFIFLPGSVTLRTRSEMRNETN